MKYHQKGIIIPHDRLSLEALQWLIEVFVTRTTDTGYTAGSLEEIV
ncbi:MAG: YheU family protein [Pseudomonadota bacterium]